VPRRLVLHHASEEGTVHALVLAKGGMTMQRNEAGALRFDVATKEENVVVTGKRQPISALEYTPAEILTGARYRISLFDALQTQLGLKHENKRVPIDVLQIDYAEEK
jgi:hypothetical protein